MSNTRGWRGRLGWPLLLVFLFLAAGPMARAVPVSLENQRTLWLGDSITAGGDYVTFVLYYLDRQVPQARFDIVSIGLASETTSGLSEKVHPFPRPCVLTRLPGALSLVKPSVVVACYGMNDGIYHPLSQDRFDAFKAGIGKLISESKAAGAQVVLLTPPPFDRTVVGGTRPRNAPDFSYLNPYEDYDSVLGAYADWERTLSAEASVIDLHAPMDAYIALRRVTDPHFSFTRDGIHPGLAGNLLMAEIILKGLGYTIPFDADLDRELAKVQADPLYALVRQQRELRTGGWLAYVGYTRDQTVKTDSVTAQEQAVRALQGRIDTLRNRAP